MSLSSRRSAELFCMPWDLPGPLGDGQVGDGLGVRFLRFGGKSMAFFHRNVWIDGVSQHFLWEKTWIFAMIYGVSRVSGHVHKFHLVDFWDDRKMVETGSDLELMPYRDIIFHEEASISSELTTFWNRVATDHLATWWLCPASLFRRRTNCDLCHFACITASSVFIHLWYIHEYIYIYIYVYVYIYIYMYIHI